ncbi:hypothetical protein ACFWTC_36885 [Streptomyces sp. NPDC058619]|uniref:hypothetical protein n=1 Tax=unclassified Streptomyces TaxID=2593676 RepID=UPI0036583255
MTARDGHGAILTHLEQLLGMRASVRELLERALEHDEDHPAWGGVAILLGTANPRDHESWTAAAALRTHPAPSHRLLGAELMRLIVVFTDSDEAPFVRLAVDALTDWSDKERDPAVLATVLSGIGSYAGTRAEAAVLAHADHADAGVRRAVACGLSPLPQQPAAAFEALEFERIVLHGVAVQPGRPYPAPGHEHPLRPRRRTRGPGVRKAYVKRTIAVLVGPCRPGLGAGRAWSPGRERSTGGLGHLAGPDGARSRRSSAAHSQVPRVRATVRCRSLRSWGLDPRRRRRRRRVRPRLRAASRARRRMVNPMESQNAGP